MFCCHLPLDFLGIFFGIGLCEVGHFSLGSCKKVGFSAFVYLLKVTGRCLQAIKQDVNNGIYGHVQYICSFLYYI